MRSCHDQLTGEEILNALTTIKGIIDYFLKNDYPEEVLMVDWEKICFLVRNYFGLTMNCRQGVIQWKTHMLIKST